MNQSTSLRTKDKSRLIHKAEPYLFLLPALFFAVVFTYYPFLESIINSFFKLNVRAQRISFIGLKNYAAILSSANFRNALWNSLRFTALTVPFNVLISLSLALLAEEKRRFHRVYEVLFSLPMAISMSAACMIFKLLLNNSIGLFNYTFGLNIAWFHDRLYAMPGLAAISVWMSLGYEFLFLSAALRNVPQDLLEAAKVDGARWYQRTTRIVIPLISPTIFYLVCLDVVTNMMMSGPALVLTNGGPRKSTETLVFHLYQQTVSAASVGYGYALSIIIFFIVFLMILLTFRFEKKGVFYS